MKIKILLNFIIVLCILLTCSNNYAQGCKEGSESKIVNVGKMNIREGDYVEYSVTIAKTGWYSLDVLAGSYGSKINKGRFAVAINNIPRGYFDIPYVGQNTEKTKKINGPQYIYLSRGKHSIYFVFFIEKGCRVNFNKFILEPQIAPPDFKLVGTSDETGDIIVGLNVKDSMFGAIGDGRTDDTAAIQKALDTAYYMGGGTVYIPEGMYRIEGTLHVPASVILRGKWSNPVYGKSKMHTVLMVYNGKDNAKGNPFLTVGQCGVVMELGIWYPQQDFTKVSQYPWTIASEGNAVTIKNITLYNSYNGIKMFGSAMHVYDIYGTVLNKGIIFDNNWEVSDIVNVTINNDIWKNVGFPNSPINNDQVKKLNQYTRENVTGIILGKNDDVYLYNIDINDEDVKTGIHLIEGTDLAPPGWRNTYGIFTRIYDSTIKIDAISSIGITITDDVIGAGRFKHAFSKERRPENTIFFNVREPPFDAVGDGVNDDTSSIKAALDAAKSSGGGTVFLPPGGYKITGNLVIPEGVELRGAFEGIHTAMHVHSTVLLAYNGMGTEHGTPFITLLRDSGIHGLTVKYPQQEVNSIKPYPWTIKGEGKNVWVEYVNVVNGYNLINMYDNKCDNFTIKGVWATALNKGIAVGGGSKNGFMEYNMISYGMWQETAYPDISGFRYPGRSIEELNPVKRYIRSNTTAYIFGDVENIKGLSNFAFDVFQGYEFARQNGNGCRDSTFFRASVDTSRFSNFRFHSGSNINLIGVSSAKTMYDVLTEKTFNGRLVVYGRNKWSDGADKIPYGDVSILGEGQGQLDEGDKNLCLNKAVKASSSVWKGSRPENAIDGDRTTGWVSEQDDSPYLLEVDLGDTYLLHKWRVKHAGVAGWGFDCNTRDFRLQVSSDGNVWKDVDIIKNNTDSITESTLAKKVKARFVRLLISNPVQFECIEKIARIQELEVYGKTFAHQEEEAKDPLEPENIHLESNNSFIQSYIMIVAITGLLVIPFIVLWLSKKDKSI